MLNYCLSRGLHDFSASCVCTFSNFVFVLSGLLTSESTAMKASNILKEMINHHIDVEVLLSSETDENNAESKASRLMKSLCDTLLKVVNSNKGIPNEHVLAVISVLFVKLGMSSYYLCLLQMIH